MALSPGAILQSRYRIARLIRSTACGSLYRVWDLRLDLPRTLQENHYLAPDAQRRFEQAGQRLLAVEHPGLLRVHAAFCIPGQGCYLVLDSLEGETLEERLARLERPVPQLEAVPWAIQVGNALAVLHAQNPPILHLQVSPDRILLTPQGRAVLADFGAAGIWESPSSRRQDGPRGACLAPELQAGLAAGAHSDVYALGACLYQALTLTPPTGSRSRESGTALPAPGALQPGLSPHIEAAVLRALEMDPDCRFASAKEMVLAFCRPAAGPQPAARSLPDAGSLPAAPAPGPAAAPLPAAAPAAPADRRASLLWLLALSGALIVLCGALAACMAGLLLLRGSPAIGARFAADTPAVTQIPPVAAGATLPPALLASTPPAPVLLTPTLLTPVSTPTQALSPAPVHAPSVTPAPTRTPIPCIDIGCFAPDFRLSDLDGSPLALAGFRGQKVILNFWATWCPPCKAEMPYFKQMHEKYAQQGLVILGIATDGQETLEAVPEFVRQYGLTYPILLDSDLQVSDLYRANYYRGGIPKTYFMDENGYICSIVPGSMSRSALEAKIQDLLGSTCRGR